MRKPRISLKTLMFGVTLAAVLLGWYVDRRELLRHSDGLEAEVKNLRPYREVFVELADLRATDSTAHDEFRKLVEDVDPAPVPVILDVWKTAIKPSWQEDQLRQHTNHTLQWRNGRDRSAYPDWMDVKQQFAKKVSQRCSASTPRWWSCS